MWVFYKSVSYINSMMRALWHSTAEQARKLMSDMLKCRDFNDTDLLKIQIRRTILRKTTLNCTAGPLTTEV